MGAYYNELNPYAAQWLRNLIAAGQIALGDVDERSIEKVSADDLTGYSQCHFFAGIGGWSYALRLAGWPDERPVWTGSCPCQPLSGAGQRKGHADKRHLWPAFYRLITERRPRTVFGEQVAGSLGREWLAGVRADLEQLGYACGAADLPAASVGAPHIRQRLWFVADDQRERSQAAESVTGTYGSVSRKAVPEDAGRGIGLADAECPDSHGLQRSGLLREEGPPGAAWAGADFIPCLDGKARRAPKAESGIRPLAYGATARVGRLRAYGNAIVPQTAAEFIRAFEGVRRRAGSGAGHRLPVPRAGRAERRRRIRPDLLTGGRS